MRKKTETNKPEPMDSVDAMDLMKEARFMLIRFDLRPELRDTATEQTQRLSLCDRLRLQVIRHGWALKRTIGSEKVKVNS